MFLPRFSIRTMMVVAIAVALAALLVGMAVDGKSWAIAVTVALGGVVLAFMMYVLFYGMVALFARVAMSREFQTPRPAYYPAPRQVSADEENGREDALNSSDG